MSEQWSEDRVLEIIKTVFAKLIANDLMSDGAELPRCKKKHTRVISCDTFQESHDFIVNQHSLVESAGHRAITQNLSDLAAMGAKPVGFVWSLEIPKDWLDQNAKLLRGFCEGAARICEKKKLKLLGGDLSLSETFSCTTTILGDVKGKPISRRGAQVDDRLYISREIGASSAGLAELLSDRKRKDKKLIAKHIYPEDEIELGQKLVGVATACMDLSDGLGKDLKRLCDASKVNVKLDDVADMTAGAEVYALLFTGPDKKIQKLEKKLRRRFVRIGTVVEGKFDLAGDGYDHFSRA